MQFQLKKTLSSQIHFSFERFLDTLVATLRKSGKENFVRTRKYMGNDDIVFQKGHFPYTYFDCLEWTDWT